MQAYYPTIRDEDPRPWDEIRRTLRRRQQRRRSHWSVDLIGVLLVLLLTIPSTWWIHSEFTGDFSGLNAVLQALAPPRGQPEHRIVGYTGQEITPPGDPSHAAEQNPTGT